MNRACVVDTSVVVSGLLTADSSAPTARIVDAMVAGRIAFLVSVALLAEYRIVLLRPRIRARHGLDEAEVDTLLTEIATNGMVREPARPADTAPDPGDQHLWDLLATEPSAVLITGDRALLEAAGGRSVMAPRDFVEQFLG